MLTVRAAFCFFIIFGAFKETFSWTIDLPQVRKYVFEKSFKEDLNQKKVEDRVVYDNIHTNSQHFDYQKYRKHSDEDEYHSYMEQKVHDAVRNGSEYLEGLRRAIEDYTRRLEECRRMNVTANIIQLRSNLLNFTGFISNVSNQNQPTNFTVNLPPNATDVISLTTTFPNFMNMSANFTMLNTSEEFRECMRADQASEHVRRLAQLAIWAANELQDKLYADKYEKHGAQHDDSLILRLAWFLDRLAHLTGYDPKPHDFITTEQTPSSSSRPTSLSWVPTLISTEDLQFLLTCMSQNSSQPAPERCAMPRRNQENPDTFMSKGWPAPPTFSPDLSFSGSENHEYTYSEQDYAEENMPLSLPPRPMTAVKSKRKRSVQEDPLQDLFKYYAKYKAWTGSNLEIDDDDSKELSVPNSISTDKNLSQKRVKRFIVIKKFKYLKPENPMPDLSSYVKHKLGVHYNKDKEEASKIKKILEKLIVKRPAKTNLKKHKKSKRSVKYMNKFQPRVPMNPQGDMSYYIKNKEGTNYDYNVAQAARVRVGLDEVFQNGNIEVVRRYGSNYNPANQQQILSAYARGLLDV